MNYSLDLTAYRCPLPLLITQRAAKQLKAGDCLILTLAPDALPSDFAQLCQRLNLTFSMESERVWRLCCHSFVKNPQNN